MKYERCVAGRYYADTTLKHFSLSDLSQYFDSPLLSAAAHLGVSDTFLKKQCRLLSIRRWPYRRIQALQAQKNQMDLKLKSVSNAVRERWLQKTKDLELQIAHLKKYGTDIPVSYNYKDESPQYKSETIGTVDCSNGYISKSFELQTGMECKTLVCFPLKLDIYSLMNDPYIKIV